MCSSLCICELNIHFIKLPGTRYLLQEGGKWIDTHVNHQTKNIYLFVKLECKDSEVKPNL